MAHWLFPDFLQSSSAYADAERHWEEMWKRVLCATDLSQAWHSPWMRNPLPDGNPMFSAVCHSLHRGVRIIQEEPRDADDVDLDWWVDYFGDQDGADAIHELIIACCPSQENASQIEQLLVQWLVHGNVGMHQSVGEVEIE